MNIVKFRFIPYIISLICIVVCSYFLINYKIKLSTEFVGGTSIEFVTDSKLPEVKNLVSDNLTNTKFDLAESNSRYVLNIEGGFNKDIDVFKNELQSKLQNVTILSFEVTEPVVGQELVYKTAIAVGFAVLVLFIFIAYSFKSYLGSLSAILAMLHDTFLLVGFFAIFSHFFNAEVDLLFVTAVLTILSFSLYDTIVLFDRIREVTKSGKFSQKFEIIDKAIKGTMVRSINNSLTQIIVLFALALFVSGSLFWFTLALLIGVILGTYSSPFIASSLYYDLGNLVKRVRK